MNKRGVVLIFSLLVTLVLAGLSGSFFIQSITESQLTKNFTESTRAFWLAEAGIAEVRGNPGLDSASGYIDNPNYTYNAVVTQIGATNYYNIVSTGTVIFPNGESVSREVTVTVETGQVGPNKFQYGLETTTDLVVMGSAEINPPDSFKEHSTLDFAALFGVSKAEMKANATHLYTGGISGPINGITWVDVPTGTTIEITNPTGSGILVINGNVKFAGNGTFNGIVYIIGELTMRGTPIFNGSILAESSLTVDTSLSGNVTVNYNTDAIAAALTGVQFLTKRPVAWHE